MSKLIKCPKCDGKDWSSDYWYCPHCNYYETKEETLLEMNKDYFDGKGRGDEPQLDLSFWMRGQEDLTREMIDKCLPKSQYNYRVDCNSDCDGDWGETAYYENDLQEIRNFIISNADSLIEMGEEGIHWKWHQFPNGYMTKLPLYPYYTSSQPTQSGKTEIRIANWALQDEGEYRFDGEGYFPTVSHETAHADPTVKRDPNFKWWKGGRKKNTGRGHDPIWKSKAQEFHTKLRDLGYVKKVKDRFKELRKIQGKDTDKYDDG